MPDFVQAQNKIKGSETIDLRPETETVYPGQAKTEQPKQPERFESEPDGLSIENASEAGKAEQKGQLIAGGIIGAGQSQALIEKRHREIEGILSEGLEELYLAMDAGTQQSFKASGEQATREINDLIGRGKCTLKRVLEIVKKWLIMIPGVNRFFIEQEAKIKADKIMNIQRNYG